MTAILQQSSNNTGLALAREVSPGVLDSTAGNVNWIAQEPNSYKDFGGSYKLVARNPINAGRQNKKGVIVDLDADGGWQEDITYASLLGKLEGLMFANFRRKAETTGGAATTSDDKIVVGSIVGFASGDIVETTGYASPLNNGRKTINAAPAAGKIAFNENLADEAAPAAATVVKVGHIFASGDLAYLASTRTLTSTAFDFTTLGLIIGEWIYCHDDVAGNQLGANLGFARLAQLGPHAIVFDKIVPVNAAAAISDAAGVGKTVALYFGRVVKNETGTLIQRITYAAERTLGKDDTTAANAQAEYINGCILNEGQFVFNTADKGTCDWSLLGARYETRTSAAGQKAGNRPVLQSGSAYNTATDVKRLELGLVGVDTPLYAYVVDASITVKNNAKANKAIGVLGAISITEGQFAVSASVNAYFANVTAQQAIASNSNVTLDVILCKDNAGIVLDLPLITLGNGRPKITQNEVITLPLDIDAATASTLNPNTDYTAMFVLFDYLPTVAMA